MSEKTTIEQVKLSAEDGVRGGDLANKPSCCICFEPGKRLKAFTARHMLTENGRTTYKGIVLDLALCDVCVKECHRLAVDGVFPITLDEDRDVELSEFVLTGSSGIVAQLRKEKAEGGGAE